MNFIFFVGFSCAILHSSGADDFQSQSNHVSSKCKSDKCTIKINGRKYTTTEGSYANSMAKGDCPAAFCSSSCVFVEASDGCPMCKCDGYGAREPCNDNSDCTAEGNTGCQKGVCTYPKPSGKEIKTCAMSNQCRDNEECENGVCKASSRSHVSGSCVFDHQCPSEYFCDKQKMTCFNGGRRHSQQKCVAGLANQCPTGLYCKDMTCYYN